MKVMYRSYLYAFIFYVFLAGTTASVAATYYECIDAEGNILLTDRFKISGMKCKPVMQSKDKSPEVIRQEIMDKESRRKARIKEIDNEYSQNRYQEKIKEIKARYEKEILDSKQFCPRDRLGQAATHCLANNRIKEQEIRDRMDVEIQQAEYEHRRHIDELNRKP